MQNLKYCPCFWKTGLNIFGYPKTLLKKKQKMIIWPLTWIEVLYSLLIALRNVLSLSHKSLFSLIEAYTSHQSYKGRCNFEMLYRH